MQECSWPTTTVWLPRAWQLLEPDFDLVEIVEDGRQLIEAAERLAPDVIVVDITMPLLNGLDAVEHLRKAGCRAKIVFLTMHRDVTYVATALQAGASGFVLKQSASSELLTAIREAIAGRIYVTPPWPNVWRRCPPKVMWRAKQTFRC